MRESSDSLRLGGLLGVAAVDVSLEVPSGVLIVGAINMLGGVPVKCTSVSCMDQISLSYAPLADETVHDSTLRAADDLRGLVMRIDPRTLL